LDDLTRQEFVRTYEAVDNSSVPSSRVCSAADRRILSLTDPDNLVETGIEIEARLPGRREQGLSLLSGGERSLTPLPWSLPCLKFHPRRSV